MKLIDGPIGESIASAEGYHAWLKQVVADIEVPANQAAFRSFKASDVVNDLVRRGAPVGVENGVSVDVCPEEIARVESTALLGLEPSALASVGEHTWSLCFPLHVVFAGP